MTLEQQNKSLLAGFDMVQHALNLKCETYEDVVDGIHKLTDGLQIASVTINRQKKVIELLLRDRTLTVSELEELMQLR